MMGHLEGSSYTNHRQNYKHYGREGTQKIQVQVPVTQHAYFRVF